MKMRIAGIVNDSCVDGPGLRYVVFLQGCLHHCIGCHNTQTHNPDGGYFKEVQEIIDDILSNSLLDGVTISGGEPFMQCDVLYELVKKLKATHYHIMIYSGYLFEEVLQLDKGREILQLCDTLVDGKFIKNKRSLSLLYKGSSNQRIINLQMTFQRQQIVLEKVNEYGEFME